MPTPPPEPHTGAVYTCGRGCGNEFIDPAWRDFHERTAHLPTESETDMTDSRSSRQTFESTVKSQTDFAKGVADARKDGKNAS